jgi:NDP-sugar pyrophosphorylase family protein
MKIVIPMAGEGSRFAKAGYTFPKPLIDVEGKPMIQRVVENLPFDADFIFLVRKEHLEEYEVDSLLNVITNGRYEIVVVDELTEGAACTVLLAKDYINSGESLLIANSDQIMEYTPANFKLMAELARSSTGIADFIWTFHATNPKWSFAKTNDAGRIIEVAEKKPISNIATCGVYYWDQGYAFVSCAEEMIERDIRVNGEFYVCPVHNIGIGRGRKTYPFYVDKMWGIGTPEDLDTYRSRGNAG